MTLLELRIALIKQGKTITWLSHQLGYSTTYLYKAIETQKESEITKIKEILQKGSLK
jgi:hypothetical protein